MSQSNFWNRKGPKIILKILFWERTAPPPTWEDVENPEVPINVFSKEEQILNGFWISIKKVNFGEIWVQKHGNQIFRKIGLCQLLFINFICDFREKSWADFEKSYLLTTDWRDWFHRTPSCKRESDKACGISDPAYRWENPNEIFSNQTIKKQ